MRPFVTMIGLVGLLASPAFAQGEGANLKPLLTNAKSVAAGIMPVDFRDPGPVVILPVTQAAGVATQVRLSVYAGGTAPIQSTNAPLSAAVCNQTPALDARNVNEARAIGWVDTVNAGKECQLDFKAFFGGLPVGTIYTFTVTPLDASGNPTAVESAKTSPLAQLAPAFQNPRVIRD